MVRTSVFPSTQRGGFSCRTAAPSWIVEQEVSLLRSGLGSTSAKTRLFDRLEDRLVIFGEWCYACHSIRYSKLPDFFLSFDIFDKQERRFLSSPRRDELVGLMKLATVPRVRRGVFDLTDIPGIIGQSSLYDGPMEGIYLRQEDSSWLVRRAKVVRAEFVQQIGEHWSKKPLISNRLKP